MFKNYKEFKEYADENGILIVDFKEVDMAGRWHHLSVPIEYFTEELLSKGIGFDGSSYGFLSVEKSDMVFIPDLSSAFFDPLVEMPTVTMIGDIYKITGNGYERFQNDPRYIADKAEQFLKKSGISDECLFGPEFEFYLLDNIEFRNEINHIEVHIDSAQAGWNTINSPHDEQSRNAGYKILHHKGYHADIPHDTTYDLRNIMIRTLEENGIPVKYHHHENGGPGQVEIEVKSATVREMADRTQKIKYFIKNLAIQYGKSATFMPKPFKTECGSGMHIHIQMNKDGKPIFYDENGYSKLSKTALSAIAGILKHSDSLLAFTNPTTNSYKRLVPGYEAPVTVCFGNANRSSVIRIPGYAMSPNEKRFEFRPSDATCNPYLAYSAMVMAMIDGIKNNLDPTELHFGPYDKNMYSLSEEEKKYIRALPKSLSEAADALESDNDYLLDGGVFTKEIIEGQLKKIRSDALEISLIPHPVEFEMYYDL